MTPYLLVGLVLWLFSLYPLWRFVKKTTIEEMPMNQFLLEYLPLTLGLLILLCLVWPLVVFVFTAWTVFKFFTSESV